MSKYWAWGLKGTILEEREKKKEGFLNPWTSLLPKFLREKLSPDILAVFDKSLTLVNGAVDVKKTKFPFWALVFPKRSYLPPEYPHLQLWFLGDSFAPSINFVPEQQRRMMGKVITLMSDSFDCLTEEFPKLKAVQRAIVINATPFSFIKNGEGRFIGGGQSVRTFHLHYLLIPPSLEKVEIPEEKAPLVYPTIFSSRLFDLVLENEKIRDLIFQGKAELEKEERGMSFRWQGNVDELIGVITRLDEIMHRLQLSLIYAFFEDSETFIEKIAEFVSVDFLETLKEERDDLLLLGKERPLEEAKSLLKKELIRLGKSYGTNFDEKKVNEVCGSLVLDGNGDIASTLNGKVVTLRPGMGYGTFIEFLDCGFRIGINPLDSMEPEGTMESSGFFFTEKVKVDSKPSWLPPLVECLCSYQLSMRELKQQA